jgi:AcrR family transcriptional regulator
VPRLIETESRTGAVVAAINHVLARDGAAALSLRSIARQSGVSTSSLLHHYESREHLLRVAASWTGRARRRAIDRSAPRRGALAFLPADADEVVEARAWLAWLELWRSDDSLTNGLQDARLDERALLAEILDYRVGRDDLDGLLALIDGLLTAIRAPVRPMRVDRAAEILRAHVPDGGEPRCGTDQRADQRVDQRADELRNRRRRWLERAGP